MSCLESELARINNQLVDGGPDASVLDVGCGAGQFTRELARTLTAAREIVGVDPDKDSIDEARRLTDDRRVRYVIRPGGGLPHRDDRFSVVAISNALHHLDDRDLVLAQMVRVLRPGGWFVVVEVVGDGLSRSQENAKAVHHFKAAVDRSRGRSHNETFTQSGVRSIVANLALEQVRECIINDDPDAPEPADYAVSFLEEYLEYAAASERDAMVARAHELLPRLVAEGVAAVPRIMLVGRVPGR